YGSDTLYARWAADSLQLWQELFRASGHSLFIKTGVLWLGADAGLYTHQLLERLVAMGLAHEKLSASEIGARFSQISLDRVSFGVFEPDSGILLARRSVQAVVDDAIRLGVEYVIDEVVPPQSGGDHIDYLRTRRGKDISGDTFIFACGAWLPRIFPELLSTRI